MLQSMSAETDTLEVYCRWESWQTGTRQEAGDPSHETHQVSGHDVVPVVCNTAPVLPVIQFLEQP